MMISLAGAYDFFIRRVQKPLLSKLKLNKKNSVLSFIFPPHAGLGLYVGEIIVVESELFKL
jgi:hypothetical protein